MKNEDKQLISVLIFFAIIIITICFLAFSPNDKKQTEKSYNEEPRESNSNIEKVEDSEEIELIVRPNSNSNIVSNKTSNKISNIVSNKTSNENNIIPINYYIVKVDDNKIYIGGTTKINVTIKPDNATDKNITYQSSNTSIATVNSNGEIKGISEGTCNIIVNVGGGNTTLTISVLKKPSISNTVSNKTSNNSSSTNGNIKVTGISLNQKTININVGQNTTLKATISPSNATNKEVVWTSSDPSVATVSSKGLVTGKKMGVTTVTATTKDGNKIATAKVNISKKLTALFVTNGATSLSFNQASCTTLTGSCNITTPTITRPAWNILGWSTNKNATSATIGVNKKITLTENKRYYAITSKLITGTFIRTKCSDTSTVKRTCTAYNNSTSCKISVPTCEKVGVYDNVWATNENGTGKLYVVNQKISISGDYRYYPTFKHPYANIISTSERNSVKIRNFKIAKTYKVGSTRFEYESGIPSSAITNHYNFIKKVYSQMPAIFVPGKVFVMTQKTYNTYSKAYGLTTYSGSIALIDLQYDPNIKAISGGATIHELTHGWDGYYFFRKGTSLSQQSDIKTFYNELGSKKTNNLSINEWLAALVPDYYWHYLKNNTSESSNSGYKNNFTSVERNKAVALLKKYFNIAKNGYR